ncbi:hypothetical protein CEUSTIGMA_g4473.t1 [Chlamydomonas eustigma]|uniref:Uncharacterized protein n=1 Tax=Chlamydomonas eustigma TaxID=1157962 RepID=A0A250X1U6_9CHLO|nr:hypothetical protein CEUSTIGMA_g4473.t1 [Chlamydomonas eustigma]|eukprot:GAX77026.1 hypothetical protein CEUSTIGMA_g4473.t1 [Chlamydomonas eustigma]
MALTRKSRYQPYSILRSSKSSSRGFTRIISLILSTLSLTCLFYLTNNLQKHDHNSAVLDDHSLRKKDYSSLPDILIPDPWRTLALEQHGRLHGKNSIKTDPMLLSMQQSQNHRGHEEEHQPSFPKKATSVGQAGFRDSMTASEARATANLLLEHLIPAYMKEGQRPPPASTRELVRGSKAKSSDQMYVGIIDSTHRSRKALSASSSPAALSELTRPEGAHMLSLLSALWKAHHQPLNSGRDNRNQKLTDNHCSTQSGYQLLIKIVAAAKNLGDIGCEAYPSTTRTSKGTSLPSNNTTSFGVPYVLLRRTTMAVLHTLHEEAHTSLELSSSIHRQHSEIQNRSLACLTALNKTSHPIILAFSRALNCSRYSRSAMELLHISKSGGTSLCQLATGRNAGKLWNPYNSMSDNCLIPDFNDWTMLLLSTDPKSVTSSDIAAACIAAEDNISCEDRSFVLQSTGIQFYANEMALHGGTVDPYSSHTCTQFETMVVLRDPVTRTRSHIFEADRGQISRCRAAQVAHCNRSASGPSEYALCKSKPVYDCNRSSDLQEWRQWSPAMLDNYITRSLLGRHIMHCRPFGSLGPAELSAASMVLATIDHVLVLEEDALSDMILVAVLNWKAGLKSKRWRWSYKDDLHLELGFPVGSEALLRKWNKLDGLVHLWGRALLRLDAAFHTAAALLSGRAHAKPVCTPLHGAADTHHSQHGLDTSLHHDGGGSSRVESSTGGLPKDISALISESGHQHMKGSTALLARMGPVKGKPAIHATGKKNTRGHLSSASVRRVAGVINADDRTSRYTVAVQVMDKSWVPLGLDQSHFWPELPPNSTLGPHMTRLPEPKRVNTKATAGAHVVTGAEGSRQSSISTLVEFNSLSIQGMPLVSEANHLPLRIEGADPVIRNIDTILGNSSQASGGDTGKDQEAQAVGEGQDDADTISLDKGADEIDKESITVEALSDDQDDAENLEADQETDSQDNDMRVEQAINPEAGAVEAIGQDKQMFQFKSRRLMSLRAEDAGMQTTEKSLGAGNEHSAFAAEGTSTVAQGFGNIRFHVAEDRTMGSILRYLPTMGTFGEADCWMESVVYFSLPLYKGLSSPVPYNFSSGIRGTPGYGFRALKPGRSKGSSRHSRTL